MGAGSNEHGEAYGAVPLRIRLGALAAVLLLLFGLPTALLLWMTAVPGRSYSGPLPSLTPAQTDLAGRLRAHVESIASQPHNVAHPDALEAAAGYLETQLLRLGYPVHRQTFTAGGVSVRNIEVTVESADPRAPTLVVGGHYDSVGDAPGANDNGTGAAAVVELARELADLRNRSALRIRLVLFVNEEPPFFKTGSMGSLVYARALKRGGEPVLGMLSLETIGFYSDLPDSQHYPFPLGLLYPSTGNFIAFVGTTGSRSWVRRATGAFRAAARFPSVGGSAPALIQGIDWSDHWSFGQVGIPAAMVTDTAPFRYPYYHTAADTPDKVDYGRMARVVDGLAAMIRSWASPATHP
ncbi:MAG TPA: M28 family peptidase [Allosphingosinicella sp.]|nr:M28 family peptidase [Allosphingosinicella sp.]